ncbi:hypothetical protein QQF64_028091 [Cirrhinus molitorella]|uniref:Uncharacterized protein n=1 Tax=Cirrhinus molitorella TaxID=172907 RepID=A0ABR3N5R7_9TELE
MMVMLSTGSAGERERERESWSLVVISARLLSVGSIFDLMILLIALSLSLSLSLPRSPPRELAATCHCFCLQAAEPGKGRGTWLSLCPLEESPFWDMNPNEVGGKPRQMGRSGGLTGQRTAELPDYFWSFITIVT